MRTICCFVCLCVLFCTQAQAGESVLEERWLRQTLPARAVAGFAVLDEQGREAGLHADVPFPLLSVFKLHVAICLLDRLSREAIPLSRPVRVAAEQLRPDTWSPLRDACNGRDVTLSLGELLHYMVAQSDNNACDILLAEAGGLEKVRAVAVSLGGGPLELVADESAMHADCYRQYADWSTPRAVTRLLKGFFEASHIGATYRECLADCMRATTTGRKRLAAGLPPEARLGHKTGTGDRTPGGLRFACNDAGFFQLPDGRRVYMAAFVMQSLESDAATEALSAAAARAAYECLQ